MYESLKLHLKDAFRKLSPITAEPTTFLTAMSIGLWIGSFPAFLYNKVCLSMYQGTGETEKYCSNIDANTTSTTVISDDEAALQSMVAHMSALASIAQFLPLILFMIPIGSLSDRYGRKPLMLAGLAVFSVNVILLIVSAFIPTSPHWLLFVATTMFGGAFVVIMLSWACVKDVSPEPRRFSIHMSIIIGILTSGIVAGSMASGLLQAYGFIYVMATNLACSGLAFLYSLLVMKETLVKSTADQLNPEKPALVLSQNGHTRFVAAEQKPRNCLLKVLDHVGFTHAFNTVTQSRPNHKRRQLCLGLICYLLLQLLDNGTMLNCFLFLKLPPISWSDSMYSFMLAYLQTIASVGLPIITVVFKSGFRCISELPMAITGTVFLALRLALFSLSTKTWHVFGSYSLCFISAVALGAIRSQVAMQVPAEESGSVFAVAQCFENFAFMACAQFFNHIYPLTIGIFPGLVFSVSAGATLLVLFIIIYMYIDSVKVQTRSADTNKAKLPYTNSEQPLTILNNTSE